MVRLQLFSIIFLLDVYIGLNSTMVRLQPELVEKATKESQRLNSTMVRLQLFIHCSTREIKSLSQFHYGSITTEELGYNNVEVEMVSIPLWFDYNPETINKTIAEKQVSIPLWFDYNY